MKLIKPYCDVQVSAGAEVLLTQPPLDWDHFMRWMEDADRRGITSKARLVIGFPLLSSGANVDFWIALCNGGSNQEVSLGGLKERVRSLHAQWLWSCVSDAFCGYNPKGTRVWCMDDHVGLLNDQPCEIVFLSRACMGPQYVMCSLLVHLEERCWQQCFMQQLHRHVCLRRGFEA